MRYDTNNIKVTNLINYINYKCEYNEIINVDLRDLTILLSECNIHKIHPYYMNIKTIQT